MELANFVNVGHGEVDIAVGTGCDAGSPTIGNGDQ